MQRELVERAQRGDRECFGVLAEGSLGRIYNLARLMVDDPDVADDAVQEALIVAWRDLRALRDPDSFDAWLHRIVVRCVYRVAGGERRETRRRQVGEAVAASAPDVGRHVDNRDEIDRGFRRLTPEYRAVLVVHHYLGLSDHEAAEVLGIPAGTVKSRLHRATAAMRAAVEADTRTVIARPVETMP
jgi:RNA polymerase sigma-70 factor (ECF subfamily)